MTDIQRHLSMLGSANPNTRYEACELLRVSPSIPEEALTALRQAAADPNPDVADAAARALAVHTAPPSIVQGRRAARPVNAFPIVYLSSLGVSILLATALFALLLASGDPARETASSSREHFASPSFLELLGVGYALACFVAAIQWPSSVDLVKHTILALALIGTALLPLVAASIVPGIGGLIFLALAGADILLAKVLYTAPPPP